MQKIDYTEKIIERINEIIKTKGKVTVAIDGRCAAGKTTLASAISSRIPCNVFHMDDFFLRPEQRTAERLKSPGENVDHERFLSEVLKNIDEGTDFCYRPFSCKTGELCGHVFIKAKPISIIEGSYSLHPSLVGHYNLKIFVDISEEEQMKRIEKRNGASAVNFKNKWIPLEEKYFNFYDIRNKCDMVIKNA